MTGIGSCIVKNEDKIYVLILITVMDRAGAETIMMNYLRNIDRDKIQIDFLINRQEKADYEEEIVQLGSRVYHMCPLYPLKFGRYRKEFKAFLREHPEYKIIHSHLEERSYFALKIAKQMGVPIRIVHAHSVPKRFDMKMPVRLYFRHKLKGVYTHRFACSEEPAKWLYGTTQCVTLEEYGSSQRVTLEACQKYSGAQHVTLEACQKYSGAQHVTLEACRENKSKAEPATESPVIIMKNAIDTKKFAFDEQARQKIRKSLHIKEDTLVVGHIGRFTYEKNHKFLIDIFHEVNKLNDNCRLLLIGGGKPKEEVETKAEIVKKVRELGLENKVKFLGVRDDVNDLISAMDVLVMPSVSEGFPVTLMEAQAAGLRCIVSDVVTYQCNVTEEMQFMSLNQDAQEWANKVVSFCTLNLNAEEMNEKVKKAGFDIAENAKWLEEFYESFENVVSY